MIAALPGASLEVTFGHGVPFAHLLSIQGSLGFLSYSFGFLSIYLGFLEFLMASIWSLMVSKGYLGFHRVSWGSLGLVLRVLYGFLTYITVPYGFLEFFMIP